MKPVPCCGGKVRLSVDWASSRFSALRTSFAPVGVPRGTPSSPFALSVTRAGLLSPTPVLRVTLRSPGVIHVAPLRGVSHKKSVQTF
jgi:hypothetical protein